MISSTARPSAPVSSGLGAREHAVDEVAHLLREAVVPDLLEHRERPAACLRRLLDRVAVAVLAVGHERGAAQDVDVGDALGPDQLGAVVHPAGLGPARLDHARAGSRRSGRRRPRGPRPACASPCTNVPSSAVADSAGGLAVDPAGELDAVAAHVHQHAAARPLGIPEPVGVRAEVLLALADQVHRAERALVGELLRPHVLRREAELLGVHQERRPPVLQAAIISSASASVRASGFSQITCLPADGGRDRDVAVQVVGGADADDVDVRLLDQRPVVGVVAGDAVLAPQTARHCPAWATRRRARWPPGRA